MTMFHFVAFSCLFGVKEVGEEKLHRHAGLVEIEWATEVEHFHSQDRRPSHLGRTSDLTDPTQEPSKKVRRNLRGKKREEERAKREGAVTKLTERFKNILAKKRQACVKRSDIK